MTPDDSRELPGVESVDLETVRRLAAEIDWTVGELAEFYRKGTERELDALEQALAEGDAEEVRRRAHGAAGTAGTCGINSMWRLAGRLEIAAERGNLDEAAELLATARRRLAEVVSVLAEA